MMKYRGTRGEFNWKVTLNAVAIVLKVYVA